MDQKKAIEVVSRLQREPELSPAVRTFLANLQDLQPVIKNHRRLILRMFEMHPELPRPMNLEVRL